MLARIALPVALAASLALVACSSLSSGAASAPQEPVDTPAASDVELLDARDGSASDSSAAVEQQALPLDAGTEGVPAGSGASIDDVLRAGAIAAWSEAPGTFALSLPASADCWPSVLGAQPTGDAQLVVELVGEGGPCSAPDGARTYVLAVPEAVDASAGLEVVVEGMETEPVTVALPAP